MLAAILATPLFAEGRFTVEGTVLTFDTEIEEESNISEEDVDAIFDILRQSEGLTTLRLNSGGGDVWAADRIAEMILDFDMDTEVVQICSSSCVAIFLAGKTRRMPPGAKLGFHQSSWSPSAVRTYYEDWAEEEGWNDPFEFASWSYRDTQDELYRKLKYMIGRGVDAEFAIETLRYQGSGMWYPRRSELVAAGVIAQ